MRSILKILFLLLLSRGCFGQSHASGDPLNIYRQANLAYQKQEYDKAIEIYNSLIAKRQFAPELYFNLGNAYYKQGDIPRSILNYERALKMDPKDEDAQFNLKIALLNVIDKIDPVPQIFYKRWMNSLTELLSSNAWGKLVIAILWLSLCTSLLYLFGSSVRSRKLGFLLTLGLLVLFSSSFILAARSHSKTYREESAIVMSASVYVKSSPDPKGTDLFIIHEGSKVELLDELNNWKKIKLLNGSIGWLLKSEIEII